MPIAGASSAMSPGFWHFRPVIRCLGLPARWPGGALTWRAIGAGRPGHTHWLSEAVEKECVQATPFSLGGCRDFCVLVQNQYPLHTNGPHLPRLQAGEGLGRQFPHHSGEEAGEGRDWDPRNALIPLEQMTASLEPWGRCPKI